MDREPIVAGKFYPGTLEGWKKEVAQYLTLDKDTPTQESLLAMLPHAGYIFSGRVAGKTLAQTELADTVLLLGPNHTGQGSRLSVWPDGKWHLPGTHMEVESTLAQEILTTDKYFQSDYSGHMFEHSLEVILPFLWMINNNIQVVPICVAEPELSTLLRAGENLASILKNWPNPVSIIVSSDMSHFITSEEAKAKDDLAIQAIQQLDPESLYSTVRQNNISMCGVFPMTLGLQIANELGASKAKLVEYANAGDVTGDYNQVVAYAGMLIQ